MKGPVAVRMTCFAILSAIESDLRYSILELSLSSGHSEILPPDVRANAARRWDEDHQTIGTSPGSDTDLLDYTDFADLAKILHTLKSKLDLPLDCEGIASGLLKLAPSRNRVCHSRPLEDSDFSELYDFANSLTTNHKTLKWSQLLLASSRLVEDPSYVLHLTIPSFWSIDTPKILNNLPLPEFDDTGFLGRVADRQEIHKLMSSPTVPVVTIVGEGGVGKTTLALRFLYDIVADEPAKYDAVIWVSLKTKALTARGASEIRTSIVSTLSLVQTVVSALGNADPSQNVHELLDEILGYMSDFRILLAIDNFETLTDLSLRSFLSQIPIGSKVLITSRVGLGEIELRYKLDPMDVKTSAQLMRKYGKTLNVDVLTKTQQKTLERYCVALFNNPLLIKWFVSSVALGADPDKSGTSSTGPVYYALTDFASEYIAKVSPPPSILFGRVQSALKKLREMTESASVATAAYKYEIKAIRADTRDQRISAAYLQRALEASRISQIEQARYLINEAKSMLPTYAEPYRISGFIESAAGNLYRASEEYEDALRIDPNSAIARYTYATFLAKYLEDNQEALVQLEQALRTDPEDPTLRNAKALALMRLGKYPEAAAIYETLLETLPNRRRWWIPTVDQAAECYRRWAEQASAARDDVAFGERIRRSLQILKNSFVEKFYDEKTIERFKRVIEEGLFYAIRHRSADFLKYLLNEIDENRHTTGWYGISRVSLGYLKTAFSKDRELINQLDRLTLQRVIIWQSGEEDTIDSESLSDAPTTDTSAHDAQNASKVPLTGVVTSLTPGTLYGFITCPDESSWFFHKNHLERPLRLDDSQGENSRVLLGGV